MLLIHRILRIFLFCKDAAATAMYGSRAANGVVVITTVAPKAGEVRVSYNFTGTLEMPDLRDYNLAKCIGEAGNRASRRII